MSHFELMVLLVIVGIAGQGKTTYAESAGVENNKTQTAVIEDNKNVTVRSGLNVEKNLVALNVTDAANISKIRRVTPVGNDSLEKKPEGKKAEVSAKEEKSVNTTTTTAAAAETIQSLNVTKISTEAGLLDIKAPTKLENTVKEISSPIQNSTNIKKDHLDLSNSTDKNEVKKQDKNNTSINLTIKEPETSTAGIPKTKSTVLVETNLTSTNKTGTLLTPTGSSQLANVTSSTTSTTTTSTTTTTTTKATTTTTPKPKKPTITYGTHDFPDLEKDNPEYNSLHSSASKKLPVPDVPYTQPSQELNSSNYRRGRDFILPIVSMLFIIPLVIGILITSYRRFRDCWSTRHYRRMDFLVDGMYND